MTRLVLSAASSDLLRRLVRESDSDHHAVQSLKAALEEQPEQPKMTTASPAVPTTNESATSPSSIVLDHKVLISIASWAQSDAQPTIDSAKLKLSSLVAGSHVYVPPKPVFQRSKELEDSLAAIRQAQEQAEYQRMSTFTSSSTGYKIPSSYVNIAGVDPSLSLSQRISSHTTAPHLSSNQPLSREAEEKAWKDAQRTLSVILNIFLSALATATAAWWASGNAKVGNKVLVSMLVALVTAVAEGVLYSRYSVYVQESKKVKTNRMKGSDVKGGIDLGEFKPLQLGGTPAIGSSGKSQPSRASKEPS
ncbi:ATPase, vacuolar ER assembly factor, Vma12 [Kalmanozyma brasiliensis GHG001]|uniref:ATPase, vacuolar ER assembly factor, Vma12 n=1 Tax=Kalmanozyma brasiliensis (strain GHG001) TaxID=1365824 RepID=V5EZL2_KALBG|nr:ATPase, vacuolar ER assembly factor, Vma12 [Kalmanozyma brasiliensis GHG001]EST08324.1 ATPase, vacuolar ER assembly factor, Vma12 [Kalmanozyma brasiliensis GHG001]